VSIGQAVDVAARLSHLGLDELSLGDTIGVAAPLQVQRVADGVASGVPLKTGVPQKMGTRRPFRARNVSVSGRSGSSDPKTCRHTRDPSTSGAAGKLQIFRRHAVSAGSQPSTQR